MPGLLRAMARTAAVVGTATATRNIINRRQADRNARAYADAMNDAYGSQPQAVETAPPVQAQAAQPQPAQTQDVDPVSQLERLAELKKQGVLTDEEFQAEKAKILAE